MYQNAQTFFVRIKESLQLALTQHLELYLPDKEGATLSQRLESVARQTGKTMDELKKAQGIEEVDVVHGSEYLMQTFFEMADGRQAGMNGSEPLSWQDISNYLQLMDETLEPWEIKIIKALDKTYLQAVADKRKQE